MAHSADYQTELYIKRLERATLSLVDEGNKLKEHGHDSFALSVFNQADQLKHAISELRYLMGCAPFNPTIS